MDRIYQSSHTVSVHLATIYNDTFDCYLTDDPSHDDSHCTHYMLLEGDMNLGPASNTYKQIEKMSHEGIGVETQGVETQIG